MVIENRVKRIFREGGLALGAYSGCFGTPEMVEIIGHAGFDAVFIDMEHNRFDLRDVHAMVVAADHMGITSVVRTPGFDPGLILRLLDMGVQGIYLPHVSGAEGARAAVEAIYYPPLGDRGMAGSSRAASYGKVPLLRHLEESNREVLLTVMIEDLQALEEAEEIAGVKGVDLVAVGPTDISRALGVSGQVNHPKLVAAMERVAEVVTKSDNARLSLAVNNPLYPRSLRELKEMGVSYTNCGPFPEVRLMRQMSQQVADLRRNMES
jgi:4-hydroxy-2-oxoheptanedioate aldolase